MPRRSGASPGWRPPGSGAIQAGGSGRSVAAPLPVPGKTLLQGAGVQFEQMVVEVVEVQRRPLPGHAAARRPDLIPPTHGR